MCWPKTGSLHVEADAWAPDQAPHRRRVGGRALRGLLLLVLDAHDVLQQVVARLQVGLLAQQPLHLPAQVLHLALEADHLLLLRRQQRQQRLP
jgi:hypothetical protein